MSTTPPPLDWHDLDAQAPPDEDEKPTAPAYVPTFGPTTDDPAYIAERARVLRFPDIAKRLCEPPLSYSRPEVWNGWVPPEMWRERINDSPQRKQLLEIITAAVQAEKEAGGE